MLIIKFDRELIAETRTFTIPFDFNSKKIQTLIFFDERFNIARLNKFKTAFIVKFKN